MTLLYHYMYDVEDCICLSRKKEKFEKLKTQITTSQKEIKNLKREISRLKNKKDSGNSYQKLLSEVIILLIIVYS